MTQLPEVEVVRKDLEREIVGKRVKEVHVRTASLISRQRNRPEFYKALDGRRIEAVTRRGVSLMLELDDAHSLVVRCGRQATITRETATAESDKKTQLVISFSAGGAIHYRAPEADGELAVLPTDEVSASPELSPPGIDPLADQFTWTAFSRQLVSRHTELKALLLDQTFIVGLGDLYADEILWAAGLSGRRRSQTLSAQEVRRLYRSVLEVLYEAIKRGGSPSHGETGDPSGEGDEGLGDHILVYGHAGQPCARCRQPIVHESLSRGVSSFYCANCQT